MKFFSKAILIPGLLLASLHVLAQDSAADLVKQGVQLNDQGKYTEAIEKYSQALKLEPESAQANYQMGFTLLASGKATEGIPFAEKAIKANGSATLTAASYVLLGSIYDQDKQIQKAIDTYKEGIKLNPNFQGLHFNLGISYSRNKQYPEAEAESIEAIKLDPKHASSQRMYALVTFHQNKRVNALLAFCSFIILEPNTQRSAEAYTNIQSILKGGVLKDNAGRTTIILSPKDNQETQTMNLAISMTASSAQSKKLSGMDLLEYELKHIFNIAGELQEKKTDKSFFEKFFADYFHKLAQSDNMPAFARMVGLSANKDENTKWMTEHDDQVKALDKWVMETKRDL